MVLPDAVRRAYEAEIERLEKAMKGAIPPKAAKIQEAIADLEAELVLEDFLPDD